MREMGVRGFRVLAGQHQSWLSVTLERGFPDREHASFYLRLAHILIPHLVPVKGINECPRNALLCPAVQLFCPAVFATAGSL